MRKSAVWLLAGVMIFAFIGLLVLQLRYIDIIRTMQEEQFRVDVNRSLVQVSRNVQMDESSRYLDKHLFLLRKQYLDFANMSLQPSFGSMADRPTLLQDMTETPLKVELMVPNDQMKELMPSAGRKLDLNTHSMMLQKIQSEKYDYFSDLVHEVIWDMTQDSSKPSELPIEERINFRKINDYIRLELAKNMNFGRNEQALPFSYAIFDSQKREIFSTEGYNNSDTKKVYSQVLFPQDSPHKQYTLRVYFPSQDIYVLNSMEFIAPSIGFTFVLLMVFIFTLYIILRQKRLSEMKTDFVNNMTHELKTPVASISLAAQTLNDAAVNQSPKLMEYARSVITDESKRLSFLVEKVLQMSLFDDGMTSFKFDEVDVNDLIASIANTFALRVEKTGGSIDIELNAMESTVRVDKMHFTNVLFNLMENAVKYRKEDVPLELIAKTDNVGNKVQITIQDNGIGMKSESIKKIFEKFYRVPTGNKHDVKGFGLGLAYVKRIVSELDGTIKVESKLGEGTRFIITLPSVEN